MKRAFATWNHWTDDDVQTLGEGGALVFDNVLGGDVAARTFSAIARLAGEGELRAAAVGRQGLKRLDGTVRQDLIAWLDDQADPAFDATKALFEAVRVEVNAQCWLGLERFDTQVALYPGDGAHYERHRDAFLGPASRRLTAIYYPNVDWEPSHGGQLRVFFEDGSSLDIEPIADRLVIFLSDILDHQVLPVFQPRCAVTAWYYR